MTKKLYTAKQACEALQVTRQTLRNWEKRGTITPVRIGGVVRYDLAEINESENNDANQK